MTVGLKDTILNAWLDGLCSSTTWTEPAAFYVKLHTADPGASGTTAPAGETTRQGGTTKFSAASGGAITSDEAFTWTNVSTAETYSHISFWDTVGPAGGTFLGSAALTAPKTVAIGDNFTIPIGDLDLSITPVAAG